MGWQGWSQDVTLDTDLAYLELAYRGRIEMLQVIFGKKDAAGKTSARVPFNEPGKVKTMMRGLMQRISQRSKPDG